MLFINIIGIFIFLFLKFATVFHDRNYHLLFIWLNSYTHISKCRLIIINILNLWICWHILIFKFWLKWLFCNFFQLHLLLFFFIWDLFFIFFELCLLINFIIRFFSYWMIIFFSIFRLWKSYNIRKFFYILLTIGDFNILWNIIGILYFNIFRNIIGIRHILFILIIARLYKS